MLLTDPTPESEPVLITSDGEKGDTMETVKPTEIPLPTENATPPPPPEKQQVPADDTAMADHNLE